MNGVAAREALEEGVEHVGGNAGALVAHGDAHPASFRPQLLQNVATRFNARVSYLQQDNDSVSIDGRQFDSFVRYAVDENPMTWDASDTGWLRTP